jgi:cell division septal protein FtsQ
VARRLPGALRVVVREVEPVAFVPGPRGLAVVDALGRALPFDPSRSELDLPIAATADSGVLAVLALIQSVDATLYQDITAARRMSGEGRGDVMLEWGPRRVLLRRDAGPEVIQAVVLVAQDLAAKARPYGELDARYAGQVVVRRRATGAARRGA